VIKAARNRQKCYARKNNSTLQHIGFYPVYKLIFNVQWHVPSQYDIQACYALTGTTCYRTQTQQLLQRPENFNIYVSGRYTKLHYLKCFHLKVKLTMNLKVIIYINLWCVLYIIQCENITFVHMKIIGILIILFRFILHSHLHFQCVSSVVTYTEYKYVMFATLLWWTPVDICSYSVFFKGLVITIQNCKNVI
jgi:hypothetical protein